jgi:hypothetical protein
MVRARQCRYCKTVFTPSAFHPQQQVCCSDACRLQRRRDYRREHYRLDEVYRQVCLESAKKWRQSNPGYSRQYRQNNPAYVQANRAGQKRRDRARRLHRLAKNTLALALNPPHVEVLLVGPDLGRLAKNNLAISQIALFEPLAAFATRCR